MQELKKVTLPYARMITRLMQRLLLMIESSKFYNTSLKQINISTYLCRNVIRSESGKFTYVEAKKRKINHHTPPPSLSSNAPQTQQEDPLKYIDDLELSPSHREIKETKPTLEVLLRHYFSIIVRYALEYLISLMATRSTYERPIDNASGFVFILPLRFVQVQFWLFGCLFLHMFEIMLIILS